MSTIYDVFEAVAEIAELEDMDDDTVIPIWPTGTEFQSHPYPQLTVGMVREFNQFFNHMQDAFLKA